MFDPSAEPPIPLAQARALPWLPKLRRGRRISLETIHRWATKGVRGCRLEAVRVGGTLCTSEDAMKRFIRALSEQPAPPAGAKVPDARRAEAELDRAGIL